MAYAASSAGAVRREARIAGYGRMEHRRSERHLTLQTGRIIAAGGSIECAILNVSDHGACILVPDGAATGDRFALLIDGSPEPHYCSVAWRDGSRLGVSYDGPQTS